MIKKKFDYTLESFCEEVEKTDGIKVIYSFNGIVIVNVSTFKACNKFFNAEGISWCIAQNEEHFKNYCLREGNSQYFIIDFNKLNSSDLEDKDEAMIGFTIREVDGERDLYAAHSKSDGNLLHVMKRKKDLHPFEVILKEKKLYDFVIKNKMKCSEDGQKKCNILSRLLKKFFCL